MDGWTDGRISGWLEEGGTCCCVTILPYFVGCPEPAARHGHNPTSVGGVNIEYPHCVPFAAPAGVGRAQRL
eukprot:141771-Chlamydomonas_euryale.AAC.1